MNRTPPPYPSFYLAMVIGAQLSGSPEPLRTSGHKERNGYEGHPLSSRCTSPEAPLQIL
jgi:hypothetical protein